jgi:hypothetical protein
MNRASQGRDRETAEIVRLRRAAVAGRLMLGELDGPFEPTRKPNYLAKPRREIKAE